MLGLFEGDALGHGICEALCSKVVGKSLGPPEGVVMGCEGGWAAGFSRRGREGQGAGGRAFRMGLTDCNALGLADGDTLGFDVDSLTDALGPAVGGHLDWASQTATCWASSATCWDCVWWSRMVSLKAREADTVPRRRRHCTPAFDAFEPLSGSMP